VTGQLTGIDGVTTVGLEEHPGRDVAADSGSHRGRDGGVSVQSSPGVVVTERPSQAAVEPVGLLVNPVRVAQPAGRVDLEVVLACGPGGLLDSVGVRVPTFPEQRLHLRLGDVLT
jgi:hypothetical protein